MTPPVFRAPWNARQVLKFTGILNDPDEPHQSLHFYVLAGPGGPVPTGGWTQINTIDRPRNKAFTMAEGYPPLSMDVPVRFEATVDYGYTAPGGPWSPEQLETNIQKLEWMAGRGKLYANGTHPTRGNPPILQVASYPEGSSVATNLIPPNFHSDGRNDLRWMISNLQYDASTLIRNRVGNRSRQDITVSLIEYVAAPGAAKSPRDRQRGRGSVSGYRVFVATQAVDTIAKICLRHGINTHHAWSEVVQYNLPRLHARSYNKHLKAGTKVHIPKSLFDG